MNAQVSPEANAIARLIKAQMAIKGVTQTRLATILGISQSHLSRQLRGQAPFDLDQIFIACHHLGIDPQEVLVRGIRMAQGSDGDHFSIVDAVSE